MSNQNYDQSLAAEKINPDNVFIKRIPDKIYSEIIEEFSQKYGFHNGERMRMANYYVGISRSISDEFNLFIESLDKAIKNHQYSSLSPPDGFNPFPKNLLQTESNGGFSLGSFDMAVSDNGLQNIEFQAVATYPFSAAKLNHLLSTKLNLPYTFTFSDSPDTNWQDFINLYRKIMAGEKEEAVVLTDRYILEQKTNFEFYATQAELDVPVHIVDVQNIYKKDAKLYWHADQANQTPNKITRLYSRILLAEALFEDNYPYNDQLWKFRYDDQYESLKFINHPIKQFQVSKRLSPYVDHPLNPECFELSAVVSQFKNGELSYRDYVWKHKWGAAGHRLILSPSPEILKNLVEIDHLDDYIAQKKVNYRVFRTEDGQDKIIELRFMPAYHLDQCIIVPMARIGHVEKQPSGVFEYKIHFGDNNKRGYGFAPVMIFDD